MNAATMPRPEAGQEHHDRPPVADRTRQPSAREVADDRHRVEHEERGRHDASHLSRIGARIDEKAAQVLRLPELEQPPAESASAHVVVVRSVIGATLPRNRSRARGRSMALARSRSQASGSGTCRRIQNTRSAVARR
jgi:hypothetical protein